MRSLFAEERDDVVLDFSMMVFAITAASVGHVTVGLKRSEARSLRAFLVWFMYLSCREIKYYGSR